MFLVIPLVEFLRVLGVDIDVHHENPATFLCHVSVSSVKRSRHRCASSRWHPVIMPGAQERQETQTGEPPWLKPSSTTTVRYAAYSPLQPKQLRRVAAQNGRLLRIAECRGGE